MFVSKHHTESKLDKDPLVLKIKESWINKSCCVWLKISTKYNTLCLQNFFSYLGPKEKNIYFDDMWIKNCLFRVDRSIQQLKLRT